MAVIAVVLLILVLGTGVGAGLGTGTGLLGLAEASGPAVLAPAAAVLGTMMTTGTVGVDTAISAAAITTLILGASACGGRCAS